MKTFMLIITFFLEDGSAVYLDGWYPLEMPSLESCLIGKQRNEEYIGGPLELPEQVTGYTVDCIEKETQQQ